MVLTTISPKERARPIIAGTKARPINCQTSNVCASSDFHSVKTIFAVKIGAKIAYIHILMARVKRI